MAGRRGQHHYGVGRRGTDREPHTDDEEPTLEREEHPISADEPRRQPALTITAGDLVAVFIGGAAGAIARVALATWFPTPPGAYPWTTFTENVVGAFVLGVVLTLLLRGHGAGRRLQLLLGTGALGAFTTYSTFAVELGRLVEAGNETLALGYAAASLAAGVVAALLGMRLGRWMRRADDEVAS